VSPIHLGEEAQLCLVKVSDPHPARDNTTAEKMASRGEWVCFHDPRARIHQLVKSPGSESMYYEKLVP
jgi:hypothetical protein